jgi:predicted ArsR family transcriptional regulator
MQAAGGRGGMQHAHRAHDARVREPKQTGTGHKTLSQRQGGVYDHKSLTHGEKTKTQANHRPFGNATSSGKKQALVEQRKLEHRRQIADHLRQVADRNGNDQLRDVADRMEQKAQQHYDKRMEKITGVQPMPDDSTGVEGAPTDAPEAPADPAVDDLADSTTDDLVDELQPPVDPDDSVEQLDPTVEPGDLLATTPRKLVGRENALYRQLRNAERKFAKQMDAVERLRQLAETSSDPTLLETADQIEQIALDRYADRLAKITEFRQRFNLPAPEELLTLPTSVAGP